MSADRWGACPACAERFEAELEEFEQQVQESYGKVPAEEYIRLKVELDKRTAVPFGETEEGNTLREDWGISTNENGMFYVSYTCGCTACGFGFEFNHEQKVWPK